MNRAEQRKNFPFDGPDLSGDYLNVNYSQACKLGLFETLPDCGHKTCGLLCDPLIRQVRQRRAGRGHLDRVS